MNEATREVIALSAGELRRRRAILRQELTEELPRVNGDRVQFQQVILNLLLNAVDAMDGVDGRPRELVVSSSWNGDHVRLSVRDAGVGLSPEGVDRLFDPFYATKTDRKSIGLWVSRSFAERHHGRLWGEMNDGHGATFTLSIPVDSAASPEPRRID